ncbi:FAD-binding oxidoreductase [Leekyejoonella antrihumi]|uniref:FAD-binding oxidoreductase n=1 Tax=Leekyejoonella antrihumi TaxID=1660198 RepID=A0A563DXL2_9MICO|nr:FAD-binding protein [Leekyejoonella antrihumi]TWP34956.1 FAD-binding oxidoreductase [Leekyejoonella antrihumi]
MPVHALATSKLIRLLRRALPSDLVREPADPGYAAATQPHNSSFLQRPVVVVQPDTAEQAAAAVAVARQAGRRVVVQATGHGSGTALNDDLLLLDTSRLDQVVVNPAERTARVGAGTTWSRVQQAAESHELLALSGTSPTVGVSGYTFAGGVGWLVRPHGLASGSLRAVEYVDGEGTLRRAADDAADPADREALWAFRGGGPVGLATALEIDLHPPGDLSAGYLLWPGGDLPRLAQAWTDALTSAPDTLTSTLSLLHVPPTGPFPAELLDQVAVHLCYATTGGEQDLTAMRDAVRAVASPVIDTTGPADAATLAAIHLDPPSSVPARGDGWWLDMPTADLIGSLFDAARIGRPRGLTMIELRHVATTAPAREGVLSRPPAPFLVHMVAAAPDDTARAGVDEVLAEVAGAIGPTAPGRSVPSFREGQADAGTAFGEPELARLTAVAEALDPGRVLRFQRGLPR